MSVQMIELEEVIMVEISDESLEAIVGREVLMYGSSEYVVC
jgi:hypothetical protein